MMAVLIKLRNEGIDRRKVLSLSFVTLFILSSVWMFNAAKPVDEYKDAVVSTYTQEGTYTYTAPVTNTNPLFPVGTTLDMGHAAYFFVASPDLNMSFTYRFKASQTAKVSGNVETMIIASGKEKDGDTEQIYWTKAFPINSCTFELDNGGAIKHDFNLNVSTIQANIEGIKDQLNYTNDATVEVVNRVTYSGQVNGEKVGNVTDFTVPLVLTTAYYQLPGKLNSSQQTNVTAYTLVEKSPAISTLAPPFILMAISAIFCILTLYLWRMKKMEPDEIKELEQQELYTSFKDSISRGKLPENRNAFTNLEIVSLQELVDAAADMNSRVIYDEKAKTHFMINGNVLYVYSQN